MKKTLGVISLAVLLSVQILTPITYAVGDEDFIETYVEESADEVVEATDESEEVSDEVSDEEDVSEETDEEDLSNEDSEDEDLSDEDSEESDVLEEESDDSDSEGDAGESTGSLVESDSEEALVLSEEDEAFIAKLSKQGSVAKIAEELGINWYTENDDYAVLACIEGKYLGTKEQNNIIREYLISHAMEILEKSSSEETVFSGSSETIAEDPATEDVELTGLNENEISGNKYYNGVIVNVLAPAKSFPEGTTLSITPIKKKSELKEIKEQLVESQDEVTEDSAVVAFDISFMYSGEEVQPVTGQTVQVTFNYENHEELTDANDDKDRELKVYHLNDKDEEGNKIDDINEVTVEPVDTVKNEEGELVVEAESFSIYTIVTQVAEEGPEATEDQLANFEYGEISISNPNNTAQGITIMDRNLGALNTGVGAGADPKSYGYHYQWGNNYGFNSSWTKESNVSNFTGNKIEVAEYATGYSGDEFVWGSSNNTWMQTNNNNLWGGNSSSVIDKQGPCPEGWHVPTTTEWNQLINYYAGYYNSHYSPTIELQGSFYKYSLNADFVSGFANYFNLPFAGFRYYYNGNVGSLGDGFYWSSDLYLNSNSAHNLLLSSLSVYADDSDENYRANGYSVRCFKNTYTPSDILRTITFDFDGGSGSTAAINVVNNATGVRPSDPVKAGFAFDGWYSGDNTEPFAFETEEITSDITLTAKYNPIYTVTFDVATNDGTARTAESVKVISGEILDLGDYSGTKAGWNFVGWNTISTETGAIENPEVTGDMNLYAIFSKTVKITFDVNGNGGTSGDVDCTMYNKSTTCSITAPSIGVPSSDFTAMGWSTSSTVYENAWTVGQSKDIGATRTYYAWTHTTPSIYTATLTGGRGVAEVGVNQKQCTPDEVFNGAEVDRDCVVTLPSITEAAGYTGGLWSGLYVSGADYTLTANTTIKAIATPIIYHIIYVGAEGHTEGFTGTYTVEDEVVLQRPSKSGWNFIDWHNNSLEGAVVTKISLGSTEDKTFYAEWTGKIFNINYVRNGATDIEKQEDSCQVTAGSKCSVTAPSITRDGFTILGWNKNPEAQTATVNVGSGIELDELTEDEHVTYYAITKKNIDVTFDVNGNGGLTSVEHCTIWNTEGDCPITAPDIIPYTNNTVIGWSIGSGRHDNDWSTGETKDLTESATYFAQTSRDISAKFMANNNTLYGDHNEDVTTFVERFCTKYNNDATCDIIVPAIKENPNTPTVVGYTVNASTGSDIASIGDELLSANAIAGNNLVVKLSSNNVPVYAQTEALQKVHHIIYEKGTGVAQIVDGPSSCTIPASYNGTEQAPSCSIILPEISLAAGYDTPNWGYTDGGVMLRPGDTKKITSDNVVLEAFSQSEHFIISYYLDGGTWNGASSSGSYQHGDSFSLPTPVKDGYTFIGWTNGTTITEPILDIGISPDDSGAKVFYAHWLKDTDRIIYSNQGYDVTNLPTGHTYGYETIVPIPNGKRDGYQFSGWIGSNGIIPQKTVVISSGTRGELEYTAVWEPITYTIEYVNDGEEVLNPESFTIETPTFVLNNPTKANAEFDGWIVSGGTAPMKQIVIYKGSTENRKYTASFTCNEGYDDVAGVCTAHEYAVEYVKNGGEFMDGDIVDDIVKKEDGKYTIQVVNPIRTGFNFEGWSINMNSYTCKDASTSVSTCKSSGINPVTIEFTKGQNVTLTANWSRVDVEVTFGDVVDGHLMPGRETTSRVYTFDNGNVNLNAPRIAGYITSGWITSLGGEKEYIDGMPTTLSALLSDGNIVFPTPTKTSGGRGNVTLYAIREPITYHIIYNLNGGTNNDANLSELTIEDHTLDLEDATKTGYDFSAWIDKYGVVKTQITKDLLETVEAPYEIYLTAVWTPKTNTPYTVYHVKQSIYGTYNTGDATLTETLNLEGITDSPVTPEVNSYVGFTSPQQTTKDIAPDGKMYIVYQYERDKYDYTFVNGVAGVISNGTSESAETYYESPIVLSGKAEIGYTWSGWNIQSGDETLFVENEHHEFDMPLNNVTVTPVVIHNEYIMSYDVNGGTGDADALSSKIKYYNDSIVLPEVTREGYTFRGWWDESTPTKYAISPFNMPNNSLELTAHWEANPYTVTFHSNNGVDTTEVQNFVYDVAQDLRALSFEREGYTFLGWNTDAAATEPIYTDGQSVINLRSTSGDNLDLYAIWVSNVYTVTFHSNNGSDDTVVQNFVYDEAQDLTGLVFSKTGYSFTGWNTDASATEGIYADKQNVINLRSASGTNLDLYAIWEANDFTLYVNHFQMNLNGQYPTTPTTSGAIETKIDADITDGIAPNEYVGFELSGDAVTNIHIQPDGSSVINYYYIRNQYKVSVGENEGVVVKSGSTLSGTYYYDEDIHVEAAAIEGYTLSGWNVTSGGVTELVASGVVNFNLGTGDVDLVPVANINSYHLTVKDGDTIRFSGDVVYKTNIAEHLPQLSKAGYTFNGWTNRPTNDLMPAKDLVIEAKWTRDTPRGGGGGGGGGGGSSSEKVVFVNTGDVEKEHGAADLTGKQLTGTNLTGVNVTGTEQKNLKDMQFEELKDVTADQLKNVDRSKLTKDENEILDAYQWAYEHNVTTMVTLRDAMPEGVVTRGHLAKMVVNYATNVLGQKLPEKVPSECRWKDGAKAWESDEIKDYAVKACSLGLMGLDMDKFQPGLRVTRAQFGTIMSRLLWGKKYAGGTPYYRKHLNALKASNIMTQIGNPEGRVELRQWVWLMLMRAAMDNNK